MVLALAAAGFVLSLGVGHFLTPHGTGNADEVVYGFQAEMYREGRLTLPDDGPAFRPWMSGVVDGERIMVYPPGWPSVLAIGLATTGSVDVTVALVIALLGPAGWWFVRELTGDRRTASVAGVALLVSPFVIVHSGTWLTYLPALVCGFVAGASVLRSARTGHVAWLGVAGAALGLFFSMRPVDAVVIAVPIVTYAAASLRRRGPLVLAGLGWGVLGALPFAALTLVYNQRVTGRALSFPMHVAGGNNSFGFGARNIAEGTPVLDATPAGTFRATVLNLVELLQWIPGAWVAVPFVALGLWVTWRASRSAAFLLLAIGVIFPVVYAFFWGTLNAAVGRDVFGPFYYWPAWIPTVSFLAVGFVWLWDRRAALTPASQAVAATAVLVVAVLGTTFTLRSPIEVFGTHTQRADAQLAVMDDAPDGSLIVLPMAFDGPWILQPWNQWANTPGLDGRAVFAADDGDGVIDVITRFGDRLPFGLLAPEGPGNGGALALEPLVTVTARALSIVARTPVAVSGETWAYAATQDEGFRCRISPDGTGVATVRWRIDGGGLTAEEGCTGSLEPVPATPRGQRPCAFGVVVEGPSIVSAVSEERFWCRLGSGVDTVVVVPGQPRVGTIGTDAVVAWTGVSRGDLATSLRVEVAPLVAA